MLLPKTVHMSTLKPTATDVILAVNETLAVLCTARGIAFENLDESMIDRLLVSSFREYLGGATLRNVIHRTGRHITLVNGPSPTATPPIVRD